MRPGTGQHVKLEGGFRNTYIKRSPQVLDNNRPRKPTVLFPRTTASSSPIAKTCLIHHELPLIDFAASRLSAAVAASPAPFTAPFVGHGVNQASDPRLRDYTVASTPTFDPAVYGNHYVWRVDNKTVGVSNATAIEVPLGLNNYGSDNTVYPVDFSTDYEDKGTFKKILHIISENEGLKLYLVVAILAGARCSRQIVNKQPRRFSPTAPQLAAFIAGNHFGMTSENVSNVEASTIYDLLDHKGMDHATLDVPPSLLFSSYTTNYTRCSKIYSATDKFAQDVYDGTLPPYSFYVPDMLQNAHDPASDSDYHHQNDEGGKWLLSFLDLYLPSLQEQGPLVVASFDEATWTNDSDAIPNNNNSIEKSIAEHHYAAVISLPIKMGGKGILSYKTVAPHAYAAASEAADTTLTPILTPGSLPASTQLTTQHQRCQEIFTGNKEALLSSLTPEQATAVVEASSKLGRVWLSTIPFQPSLRVADFEVAAALQLRTLAGEREAHCTNCGEANFFGHPDACLQRRFRRVARHEGAKHIMGQALASTPGTRVRLEPLGHQTSRRNDIQVFSLLGFQATGLANAEYDLTVVTLANKDARATRLPNQDTDPSRLVNKYLDSVADHQVRHCPTSNLPFHPIVFSLGGRTNGSTTKVFASWKRVMTRGTYNLMLKRLSLCLLQARVRSFEL
ncbi:hypothetical protein JCM24511_00781 [Saitozyma sp. JCM 24511]|nr:hypothetical protein JCM24511_00781 [Saitozyma sp. JCM 24511]